MYDGQVVIATEIESSFHYFDSVKFYIFDFDISKRLDRGPGDQHAIELPECNCKPPLGVTRFDPYSWDVYCTGKLFDSTSEVLQSLLRTS